MLANDAKALTELPASPCRLGAAFTDADGTTWTFCADKASLSTYYLPKDGEEWTAYGKPSTAGGTRGRRFPAGASSRLLNLSRSLDILAR